MIVSISMVEILLSLALSLLIEAQKPNVPETLKNEAISVANYAILVAMESPEKNASSEEAPKEEKVIPDVYVEDSKWHVGSDEWH